MLAHDAWQDWDRDRAEDGDTKGLMRDVKQANCALTNEDDVRDNHYVRVVVHNHYWRSCVTSVKFQGG